MKLVNYKKNGSTEAACTVSAIFKSGRKLNLYLILWIFIPHNEYEADIDKKEHCSREQVNKSELRKMTMTLLVPDNP